MTYFHIIYLFIIDNYDYDLKHSIIIKVLHMVRILSTLA